MAIPRRKINTEFQTILASGDRNIPDQISLPSFPRAGLDAVLALHGWPQAKTVMMFSDEDDLLDSSGLGGPHPLLRVHAGRIEYRWIRSPVAPLAIHESVW